MDDRLYDRQADPQSVRFRRDKGGVAPPLVALGLGSFEGTGVIATVSLREP